MHSNRTRLQSLVLGLKPRSSWSSASFILLLQLRDQLVWLFSSNYDCWVVYRFLGERVLRLFLVAQDYHRCSSRCVKSSRLSKQRPYSSWATRYWPHRVYIFVLFIRVDAHLLKTGWSICVWGLSDYVIAVVEWRLFDISIFDCCSRSDVLTESKIVLRQELTMLTWKFCPNLLADWPERVLGGQVIDCATLWFVKGRSHV
jgi:hypothetical protein